MLIWCTSDWCIVIRIFNFQKLASLQLKLIEIVFYLLGTECRAGHIATNQLTNISWLLYNVADHF